VPTENDIRDKLSKRLGVLEPGLMLIDVNFKLPNAGGAKGFIDILARDRLGNFVIIELKRSDQSCREALFEILKYIPLFMREHGAKSHQIRCFIVSTTWHELLVPYSEFRRRCEAQTQGFRIEVDSTGNVTRVEKVMDQPEDDLARIFQVHCGYLYPTAVERDEAIPALRSAFQGAGATGHLLFRLNYNGGSPHVIYPFGAYFVPTRVEPSLLARLSAKAAEELTEAEGEAPSPEMLRHSVEDRFLELVNESLGDYFRTRNLEGTVGTPDKFVALTEGDWAVVSIERAGPYASPLVMPDGELVELVKGLSGDNSIRFERLTSPGNKLDWDDVRAASASFLRGNPAWQSGARWFFDRAEKEMPSGTVLVQIYNPLMLPESLYRFATTQTPAYTPLLALAAIPEDGTRNEAVVGTVVWAGKSAPKSVGEVFGGLCEGVDDVGDYYLAVNLGVAWELDEELMRRHGLKYSLCFLMYVSEEDKQAVGLTFGGDGAAVMVAPMSPDSLVDYFDAARPYLQDLFAQIDSNVGRFS
jgi:hypothetical protein